MIRSPNPKRIFRWVFISIEILLIVCMAFSCEPQTLKTPKSDAIQATVYLNLEVDESIWYVSVNGDDAHACHTAADACRLIATAVDRAKDGDKIYIGAGTFMENVRVTKSLSFIGEGMGSTILDGQGESTWKSVFWFDGDSHPNGILLGSISNLTILNGINATGGGWDEIDDGGGIAAVNADLELDSVRVTASRARLGGGIYFMHAFGSSDFRTLTITNSTIEGNKAESGGGIYCSGNLVMEKTTVSGNQLPMTDQYSKGAGIYFEGGKAQLDEVTISQNLNGLGSGILSSGELVLRDSWIEANDSEGLTNLMKAEIYNSTFSGNAGTGVDNRGELFIQNSTISGTQGSTTDITINGGMVNWGKDADLMAVNVTIADSFGAGFVQESLSAARLYNTLLANNGTSCAYYSIYGDPNSIITGGDNIATDDTCTGDTFIVVGDAKIGPLQDNGGFTLTHALLSNSPAVDAGREIIGLVDDQRGESRPKDGNSDGSLVNDIGSFEFLNVAVIAVPNAATPIMNAGELSFIPGENKNCRSGPDAAYESFGVAMAGQSYRLMGRTQTNDWFAIALTENVDCWVWGENGTASGDTLGLPVLVVAPPTATPTPTATPKPAAEPCSSFSAANCPTYCEVKHDPSGLPYCGSK